MWDPTGKIIQIEVGSGVVKAATALDQRSFLDKFFGQPSPPEGAILVENIGRLREYLRQEEGLVLPNTDSIDNNELQYDEVVVYMGLETQKFKVRTLDDIFNFLITKTKEYNDVPSDRNTIIQLLSLCLEDIKQENYQYAFEKYKKVYYHSSLQNYEYERIRCLSDVGNIRLKNGDCSGALTLYLQALSLCNSPNIVDANLKAQVALNAGNAFRAIDNFPSALGCYVNSAQMAYSSGNSTLLFPALINIAEVNYIVGVYDKALFALTLSKQLILSQPSSEAYQIALRLQEFITEIYQQVLSLEKEKKAQQPTTQPLFELFEELIKQFLFAVARYTAGACVYRLFGVRGTLVVSFFGIVNYALNLKGPIFNAPSQIGDGNMQQL